MALTVFTPTFGTNTFYFPITSATIESDTPFLQYLPDQSVAYGIGGLFAVLFLAFLATVGLSRAATCAGGVIASMCLMISLFLRASLDGTHTRTGGGVPMFIASFVLDSVAAYLLLFTAMLMCSKWIAYLEDGRTPFPALISGMGGLELVSCVVLEAIALPLTFYRDPWYRHIGHILHTASTSTALAVAGIGLLVTGWKAATCQGRSILAEVLGLLAAFALLCLWSCFALAQTKAPLSAVANSSEIMWYLLNVLPLGLVLVVWTVLNAPRVFSYEQYAAKRPTPPPPPPVYCRPRHSRSYGGHYEYPEQEYSYPLRAPGVPDFCRQNTAESSSDKAGREMTEEDKIQKAILRYA
ncbi:hypothetical protein GGF38_002731 [Coemansia sp. RSA 25]|nr:hypothetical protein GGF38_002731 [Coemansia sp. RSA 25]